MAKIIILLSMILLLLITGCQTQCPASICPELDYSKCPQQKCPDLDCSTCPIQIETKTIYQYQCIDGTIKERADDCSKSVVQIAQEDCPELNMFRPSQNPFDKELYSVDYKENQEYDGWHIQCGFSCSTNCRKGKEEGENINYYYCGKNFLDSFILKRTIVDQNSNIVEVVTKNAVIVFDESFRYIETICTS